MALVYRAIWEENRETVLEDAAFAAIEWIRRKGIPIVDLPNGDEMQGSWVDPRFNEESHYVIHASKATIDGLDGLRVRLVEDRHGVGQQWTTTLVVLVAEDEAATVWIDVERQSQDAFAYIPFRAPQLARTLIAEGADPRVGHVRLADHPLMTPVTGLAGLIKNSDRRLPVAVFSYDPYVEADVSKRRAEAAHARLAGVAQVFVLARDDVQSFKSLMGDDLAVWGGGARIYLPNNGPDDLRPQRHRYIPGVRARTSINSAGDFLVTQLAVSVPATAEPINYRRLRAELLGVGRGDKEMLQFALDDNSALSEELRRVRISLDQAEDAREELTLDNEELAIELARSKSHLARVIREMANPMADEAVVANELPETFESIRDAIETATKLEHLAIHPDALVQIDKLDSTVNAGAWANRIWTALRALNAYAAEPSDLQMGFYEWCQAGRSAWAWPASTKKLSMTESEYVQNNFLETRSLPIDRRVDSTGKIVMLAHMKIAEGGGPLAPRIYFHDDTKGNTGNMHVGYIGPHSNMPNKSTD